MFEEPAISAALEAVREEHVPGALVLNTERDFETLDPELVENIGLLVDRFEPLSYSAEWVPESAPEPLHRLASNEFTIGMPGDGGIAWTHQTVPPTIIVKPRLNDSPEDFVEFLVAEALVQAGLDRPEHFLGFFREEYPAFSAAVPLDPLNTYQLAAGLYGAYLGLDTREVFEAWEADQPGLYEAWRDAGERLDSRLEELPGEVASGETDFATATELACNGVKHRLDLQAPFAALDTQAYRDHGPAYAMRWAEKTFEKLVED